MNSTKMFIINTTTGEITGVVEQIKDFAISNEEWAIGAVDHLETLMTVDILTKIYNNLTGDNIKKKTGKKSKIAQEVFSLLTFTKSCDAQTGTRTVIEVDQFSGEIVERQKRLSALQRMASLFNEQCENDSPAMTIDQLADKTDSTPERVQQYISILKNPNDRFEMNIVKDEDGYKLKI